MPVAYHHDDVEKLIATLIDRFGPVVGNIYTDLRHHFNGVRIYMGLYGSGAESVEAISIKRINQTFRHLGATT